MSKARSRAAVAPLRRPAIANPSAASSVDEQVALLRPLEPLYCLRPATLRAAAERFVTGFPGDVLYAVKCNPEPSVLRALWSGGLRRFDCASPAEIRLIRQLFPAAAIYYMHPVKSEAAIRQAYGELGVRDFALDSAEELDKILAATGNAGDLGLHVRIAVPKGEAVYDLSRKFGAAAGEAASLLRLGRGRAQRLGLCFHIGSQCMDPGAYERGLARIGEIVAAAGVAIDSVDVGGGFPMSYPALTPPPLGLYFAAIVRGFAALGLGPAARLCCEPGRALVAAGASVVVRIEARRGGVLHINDGIYGNLNDAGVTGWRFPTRLIPGDGRRAAAGQKGFSFYGPTCDSADFMSGPFSLPEDARSGDWIEIGQLGAYGACLRTAFNGFERMLIVEVADPPLVETPGHLHHAADRRATALTVRPSPFRQSDSPPAKPWAPAVKDQK